MRNKKLVIIGIAFVLIALGVAYLLVAPDGTKDSAITSQPTPSSTTPNSTELTTNPETQQTQANPTSSTPGKYVDYSADIIAKTPGTKLLFFHAPWCSQCRSVESDIKSEGVPSGVTIIKIDYDSNQKLRQQYGVTLQTTFVKIDDAGKSLQKYVAYDDPHLSAVIKNLL